MTGSIPAVDPRRATLLAMDYQQGIIGSLPQSEPALARTAEAISLMRRRGGSVGYVRVAFDEADFERMPAHSPMAAAITEERRQGMRSDSPTTAVDNRIAPEPGDAMVRKTRVGAFSTTDLDAQLRDRASTTLILAGIATSGVVLSTVRDAADRDYRVIVLADACADPDPNVHAFLTERIFPRQAHVTTTSELDTLLAAAGNA